MKFIYVIAPSRDGPSKIGVAKDLRHRLQNLQVGAWQDLNVWFAASYFVPNARHASLGLGQLFATSEHAAQFLETGVKKLLTEWGYHIRGEWFDLEPIEAMQVVQKYAGKKNCVQIDQTRLAEFANLHGDRTASFGLSGKEVRKFVASLEFAHDCMRHQTTPEKAPAMGCV